MSNFDFKKEYRDLYGASSKKPKLVEVPAISFLMYDGYGDPNSAIYKQAVGSLYSIAYTIKMSKMKGEQPKDYFDYVMPPLEGLWYVDGDTFSLTERDNWLWISMIRQPDFVTQEVLAWAKLEAAKKNPDFDYSKVRLETFEEGLCVQMLHVGPYADEPETMAVIDAFIEANGLINQTANERKHHELYLSDPNRSAPEKLKTILRVPVAYK
ncbi:transcriptional regulator [Culicoidibacter larvae]|uniref:Transcriptional regulator n=2 Tax=Culicoidibacter larvae TaxID=2579976 RepID=A0A5R8QEU7_9FIRM|nr:GyrI-like domain-containing protein [Culicoidibacter larvae]TLG76561.1 transcriptional regulator [Culicoidibacter larvae]